ncbi:hypothetical protein TorRG33x02_110180 [Trema orientale]|uniref:Uncharacterized protein n=1 Tax=Trema orientale TaxID=63057 RepID=A0A2P5F5P3_TREOI|nr:hypothetical protein TorRG33x02_110180 [Trema orientale]
MGSRVREIDSSKVRDQRDAPDASQAKPEYLPLRPPQENTQADRRAKVTRSQAIGSVLETVSQAVGDIDQEGSTASVPVNDQLAQEVARMQNELNRLAAREEYQVKEDYSSFTPEIQIAPLPDGFKMPTITVCEGKTDSQD